MCVSGGDVHKKTAVLSPPSQRHVQPTALAKPCPKGPVVTSTPLVIRNSGCPGVLLPANRRFLASCSFSKRESVVASHGYIVTCCVAAAFSNMFNQTPFQPKNLAHLLNLQH